MFSKKLKLMVILLCATYSCLYCATIRKITEKEFNESIVKYFGDASLSRDPGDDISNQKYLYSSTDFRSDRYEIKKLWENDHFIGRYLFIMPSKTSTGNKIISLNPRYQRFNDKLIVISCPFAVWKPDARGWTFSDYQPVAMDMSTDLPDRQTIWGVFLIEPRIPEPLDPKVYCIHVAPIMFCVYDIEVDNPQNKIYFINDDIINKL